MTAVHVYEGDVQIRVPLVYNGRTVISNDDGTQTVDITGTIRWQSCDTHTCHIPRTESFTLTLEVEQMNVPAGLDAITPPDHNGESE